MSAICLIDTSILVEILAVPRKAKITAQVNQELKEKFDAAQSLFLPMASVLETGNHIGQNGDGGARRQAAQRFVHLVQQAIEGKAPFTPINFPSHSDMKCWLAKFPNHANRGSGLGDLSIIHDWEALCDKHPSRRVYIWSLDEHLKSYDRFAKI